MAAARSLACRAGRRPLGARAIPRRRGRGAARAEGDDRLGSRSERRKQAASMLEGDAPDRSRLHRRAVAPGDGAARGATGREARERVLGGARWGPSRPRRWSSSGRRSPASRDELQQDLHRGDRRDARRVRAGAPQHVPSLLHARRVVHRPARLARSRRRARSRVVSTSREAGLEAEARAYFALASIYEKVLSRPEEVDRGAARRPGARSVERPRAPWPAATHGGEAPETGGEAATRRGGARRRPGS